MTATQLRAMVQRYRRDVTKMSPEASVALTTAWAPYVEREARNPSPMQGDRELWEAAGWTEDVSE